MVDSEQIKIPTLAEQWSLQEEPQPVESEPTVETTNQHEQSADSTDGAVLEEKIDETSTAEESTDETPTVDESTAADGSDESTEEAADAAEEVEEDAEEQPEIKIETAPADFRFPTTNQTRHCFTRYIEYHRCIAAKGDKAPECDKFAKYYRSLCPGEWIERWNEQRENGTFPGPL